MTNGFIENQEELASELVKKGLSFSEFSKGTINTTELVAKLITHGKDIVEGIEKVFGVIKGSCSILLLNEDGIYAARDRFGYTPLVIGKSSSAWAVASETSAFPNIGFEIVKYIQPGEIILINENGMVTKKSEGKVSQICAFLWIYTGFPASSYEGINV